MNDKCEKHGADEMLFIGAGNMAEAIIKGLLADGTRSSAHITATDINEERLDLFRNRFGIKTGTDNAQAVKTVNVIVLSVKPQVMGEVLKQISSSIPRDALVISIAAGITTGFIQTALGEKTRVIRVMPNTPALVGKGMSAYCRGQSATEKDETTVESVFNCTGSIIKTEEQHMNAVTALSGSGPAYLFFLAEIMAGAGEIMGLEKDVAAKLATGTIEGAAAMLRETGLSPEELRRRVTSKGGTTEAAFSIIESEHIRETWTRAIETACKKAEQLAG